MERLVIIDHVEHRLFIEDVKEDIIESMYGGSEEAYIKDNYTLSGDFSWDYIVDAMYIPIDDADPITIEPTEWI